MRIRSYIPSPDHIHPILLEHLDLPAPDTAGENSLEISEVGEIEAQRLKIEAAGKLVPQSVVKWLSMAQQEPSIQEVRDFRNAYGLENHIVTCEIIVFFCADMRAPTSAYFFVFYPEPNLCAYA